MGKIFITIKPENIWKVFLDARIYRGGGSRSDPKTVKSYGLRNIDFDIRFNERTHEDWVYPNPEKGLSFCTTIERLAKVGIEGAVWQLEAPTQLPEGLVVNLDPDDLNHPKVNVEKGMPLVDAIRLMAELGRKMTATGVWIVGGRIVRK